MRHRYSTRRRSGKASLTGLARVRVAGFRIVDKVPGELKERRGSLGKPVWLNGNRSLRPRIGRRR